MTTPARNENCGELSREALAAALPEKIPIRKGRNGNLYLVSPFGAWYCNGGRGQDFILENGRIFSPGEGGTVTETPPAPPAAPPPAPAAETPPAAPAAPPREPAPQPPKTPQTAPAPHRSRGGIFGLLDPFGDDNDHGE